MGQEPDISTFLKSAFNVNLPQSRCQHILDPDIIVTSLINAEDVSTAPLEILAKRLAMFILLVSGQCPQVLGVLKLSKLHVQQLVAQFQLASSDFKQGRPGYSPPAIILRKYPLKLFL